MAKNLSRVQLVKGWLASLPLRSKLAIGGVVIFLAFVALLIDLVIATNPQNSANLTDTHKSKADPTALALQREGVVRDSAEQAIRSGNVSQAEDIYKAAIDSEQNIEHKLQLYVDRSEVLYDAGKYQQAIDVAKQGEPVSDDKWMIADWLSRIYEDQKQYPLAAQYYTLAGQWAKSPMNKTGLTKDQYDQKAARMTALGGK